MFDDIAPRYDLLNRIITLRLDVRWRRRAVREIRLAPRATIADIACGTGDFCRDLAKQGCCAIGVDFSMGMLAAAPQMPNDVAFVNADALELPFPDSSLDGATCGFALRNLTAVPPLFAELARTVRPGGRIVLLEVDQPSNGLLRWGHRIYFRRIVPVVGALLSDAKAYRYLPESVAYLPSRDELLNALRAAGFTEVRHHRLTMGVAQLLTATRAAESPPVPTG